MESQKDRRKQRHRQIEAGETEMPKKRKGGRRRQRHGG